MKKKIIGFFSVILCLVLVAGCHKTNATSEPVLSVDDTQPVIIEEPTPEPVVVEPEPTPVPEPAEEKNFDGDPKLACLEVTESFATANELLCLYRNGHLYSLGKYIPYENSKNYGVGLVVDNSKSELLCYNEECIYVMGDVPDIVLQEGDELRDYEGTAGLFFLVKEIGYTLPMFRNGSNYWIVQYLNYQPIQVQMSRIEQFSVVDAAGNETDWQKKALPRNNVYTVSWFEGVTYNEYELDAYWRLYDTKHNREESVNLPRELKKEGYALLTWEGIPSGTYGNVMSIPFTVK